MKKPRRQEHTLLMWSGGIDSTAMLVHFLKNTNDKLHVHHISIENDDGRYEVENEIVRAMIPILAKIRPFTYSISGIAHGNLKVKPWDMVVVGFEAGVVARNFNLGLNTPFTRWTIGTHHDEGHWAARSEGAVEKAAAAVCWPKDAPKLWLPEKLYTKAEELKMLKKAGVLHLAWYCRYPRFIKDRIGWSRCKRCKTCIEVAEAAAEAKIKMADTCEGIILK